VTYTIKAKIKQSKRLETWYAENATQAAKLYNECLREQFVRASDGLPLFTTIDLINKFRAFPLGSDFKDQTIARAVKATLGWYVSEKLRYDIYLKKLDNDLVYFNEVKNNSNHNYQFLLKVETRVARQKDYRTLVRNLSRKQLIIGRPHFQKKVSLAFAIRANRQSSVHISKRKVTVTLPKYKGEINGQHNRLPFKSDYSFSLATLKKDKCGDLWLTLVVDGKRPRTEESDKSKPQVVVGIDMGLKTTRTAVSVHPETKEILSVYQPLRVNHFNVGYRALVQASKGDRRALPFVHRKIARRRHDNIGKDAEKILSMGDIFKVGQPSSAWLMSGRLARSAADAANSEFLTRFAKRAKEAGKEVGEVNESYTSQTCRKCGHRRKMPLSERTYFCTQKACGHVEDRDVNASYLIAFRDFPSLKTKIPIKRKNGGLPRRGMKAHASEQDFQSTPPCKPWDSSRGGVEMV
jgi:transposase